MLIKVGIVGGTGYTGVELLRLLSQRDDIELAALPRGSWMDRPFVPVFQIFEERLIYASAIQIRLT